MRTMNPVHESSSCAVAACAAIIGAKWTALLVHDLSEGPRRFSELEHSWVPHATADDYDDALKLCAEEAAKLLVDEWGFSLEDAFIFLSVACDAGVAQACKPAPQFGTIARFTIPKLDATPAPFRPS